ncbi:MAG: ATP-binding cassette domain-containing protein, partial [Actinobacteria bacterium]|nr:ATP-binding cassette domain-containing protein [Actinomycetota bacterium]
TKNKSKQIAAKQNLLDKALRRTRKVALKEVHALKGISFTTHRGEAVAIIGRNGAGKSTLLRAISGLIPARTGSILTSSQPSLLGVNAALMNHLSGRRNIELGGLALGMTPAEVDANMDAIIEFSGLGEFIDLPLSTYSSGMGARLRFAIASSVPQEILMIDEALATGDVNFKKRSQERISELKAKAGTVFLVSHSHSVIRETCTRAIWLDKGNMVMDGPMEEVLSAYEQATT